jgi:hypothetical protein
VPSRLWSRPLALSQMTVPSRGGICRPNAASGAFALKAESRAERGVFIGGLIGGPNGIWSSDVFPTVPFEGLAMVP